MEEILGRILGNIGDRIGDPMTFRFVLQPTVAVFLGLRDGLRLGRAGMRVIRCGKPRAPGTGRAIIQVMWRSVRVLVLVALILDVIYQVVVHGSLYPGEAVIVGITITLLPYLLVCSMVSACVTHTGALSER